MSIVDSAPGQGHGRLVGERLTLGAARFGLTAIGRTPEEAEDLYQGTAAAVRTL